MGRPTVPEAPLRALSFTEAVNTPASEFVTVPQTVPLPPTPSGILLNKFRFEQAPAPSDAPETSPPHAQPIPISSPAAGTDSLATPVPIIAPVAGGHSAGLGQLAARLARVASPDGGSTDGASSTDGGGSSTAPSSTVGSPALKQAAFGPRSQSPTESVATLTLLSAPSSPHLRPLETAAPTLHCKFAPLPKIDAVERPATRRNSSVHAQTPRTKYPDAQDEQFAIDLDDSSAAPSPFLPTNASLGLIAGASSRPGFPGTPSRRSSGSTSGRSSSPSPIRRSGSIASSRTHSPAMSRQTSTDGLNIHYIDGAGPRSGRSSSRERERSTSTSASDVLRAAAAKEMGSSTSGSGRASPSIAVGLGFDSASHSPTLAPSSASTLLPPTAALSLNAATPDSAPSARRTVFVEPPIEDPDEADENEDSEEGGESDSEEDGDEEEEDAGREDDDDDGSDGEEDPSPETSSKTAMGAAVEVVHWHSAQSKK
ncbi:hypothetical protein RQP46_000684 [Phenoliferia psychrophenolica]